MKKYVIFPVFVILILCFFSGCSEIVNTPIKGGDLNYDTLIFNVSMKEVIESSKDFVKSSILSESSRSALFELSEEDKWQGYIKNNQWNVPSNVYGVNLNAADNKLFVNGEDLGTLQNLVHHKDEWGNYRKAVFEYNGYLYYVLDKESNYGSYIVLSSEDDYEHICFDQEGKLDSPDFSNFKIWQWYEGPDGEMYRRGNLGYAYTLRNVKMQDGSYATVTVSGFNYYNYGLRVWIKPSNGNDVKIDYPIMDKTNTSESCNYKYETKTDMDKYIVEKEEANCIFEYTNKTGKDVEIYNFIYDSRVFNFDNSVVTKTESVIVKDNETVSFYYDAEKIINDFDDNFVFANYVEEKQCYWWYYYIGDRILGDKVVVTMTNDSGNGGEKHEYIQIEE